MRLLFCCLILSFGWLSASAQTMRQRSYSFLELAPTARIGALGGVNVSLADRDVNFFMSNPALVGDTLSGWASAGYQFFLADIGQASAAYSHTFNKVGQLSLGVQHMGYGKLTGYDASGQEIGEFKSGETAIVIGKSHQVGAFRMGANLKFAFSSIAGFRSSAVMVDLGGVFIHPKQHFTVGMVVRNLGVVMSEYSASSATSLPVDLQLGATFKPEYMPMRFSVTAYSLLESTATYDDPTLQNEPPGTLDKVLRRFNFAAEILLGKNVTAMVGYNFRVHQELKLDNGGADPVLPSACRRK
ncbi:MAG: type IX secretion system protein PorQ [Bacteroidia bacterium]|nr:type IX secretion system protein PorQ [Bacteroidia bacterium]